MEKKYSQQIKLSLVMLIFFGVLFLTGTFLDKSVAEILFSPQNTFAKLITSTGTYPFYAAQVLFLGALFERSVHSERAILIKILLCAVCSYAALNIGYIGASSLASSNNLGRIFPSIIGRADVITALSVILEYPLFIVGYLAAGRSEDRLLVRRVVGLLIVMLIAYVVMQELKNSFCRPRYRTAVLGYEGVTFVPWYKPFHEAAEYTLKYGLRADEFRSFPSGHSLLSTSTMYIFPSLAWLFPKLKGKGTHLFIVGVAFGSIIMLSRMMLGAHYLSDVSAGAIIGTLSSLAFGVIQKRIAAKEMQQ